MRCSTLRNNALQWVEGRRVWRQQDRGVTTVVASYINGRRVDPSSDEDALHINLEPGTGQPLCSVQQASKEDINAAIRVASEAQKEWASWTNQARARVLKRAADIIRARCEELSQMETRDVGKPISEARNIDIPSAADALEYYSGAAMTQRASYISHMNTNGTNKSSAFAYTIKEPLGVCALFGAFNYPAQICCWKSAPALTTGNAVIFKPSELTPMTASVIAEVFLEAGLPQGVFNVVHGGPEVGRQLATHPGVSKVSFTGSVATGQSIMAAASDTLKKVTLELGGKSPLVIFEDADMETGVSSAMMANFVSQGEVCTNGTRVYVHESLKDEFLAKLLPRVKAIKVGDPRDPETQMGALISMAHMEKVLGYIESARHEGAEVLCGGSRVQPVAVRGGFYVAPTVLFCRRDDMRVIREEVFGPVMAVLTFKTEDEVVARCNDSPYALAAGIVTTSLNRAHRVAARLNAGQVWINNYNIMPVEAPFGGNGLSGIGRENGLEGLEGFTQVKTVYVEMGTTA